VILAIDLEKERTCTKTCRIIQGPTVKYHKTIGRYSIK
jgi:hypothetical protein